MQQTILLRYLTISLLLFVTITYSFAQSSKVAIISLADTTIVHEHVGVTIFTNFTDTLHFYFAVKQHIEEQLKNYLSQKYEVITIKNLPDSVTFSKGIYSQLGGLKKEIKNWLTAIKNQYDFVIFIDNIAIPRERNLIITENTSGFYTRGNYAAFYTTITFFAYRTSNLQKLDYYNLGGEFMTQIKKFNLPEDKKTFTPEVLLFLKDGFIKHLDSRIEYFLTKTYLVPQDQIDKFKANTP